MSNLKCPVCGEKIEHIEDGWCNCKNRCTGSGSIDLWLNFIRTRKALDVAVDALKRIAGADKECRDYGWKMVEMKSNAAEALKQITALEQKDK